MAVPPSAREACAGREAILKLSGSLSASAPERAMANAVFRGVATLCGVALGAVFARATRASAWIAELPLPRLRACAPEARRVPILTATGTGLCVVELLPS